jgi:hypothetical protein
LLFLADNDRNGAQNEIIFPVKFDGLHTQTWGGMTFVIHAAVGGSMNPADFGIDGGWGGTVLQVPLSIFSHSCQQPGWKSYVPYRWTIS